MAEQRAFVTLYSTRIPIDGWGILPLIGIAIAIALALPAAMAIAVGGLIGGLAVATFLIIRRRRNAMGRQP